MSEKARPSRPRLERERSDASLLACARAGDPDAFALLYERHAPALRRRMTRMLRDPALAEDVVHDAFERAFRALAQGPCAERVGPWLTTIAINRAIDVMRRRGFEVPVEPRDGAGEDPDPTFQGVWRRGTPERVAGVLAALPARERRAVLRRSLHGVNYAGIAAAEGLSVSAARSVLFRARARLRELAQSQDLLGALGAPIDAIRRTYCDVSIGLRSLRPSERVLSAVAAGFVSVATIVSFIVTPPIVGAAPDPPEKRRPSGKKAPVEIIAEPNTGSLLIGLPAFDDKQDQDHPGKRLRPQLALTMRVHPREVDVCDPITYTLTVSNLGTGTAKSVHLFSQVPEGTTPEGEEPLIPCVDSQGLLPALPATGINNFVGDIAPGRSADWTFRVVVQAAPADHRVENKGRATASNHPAVTSSEVRTRVA